MPSPANTNYLELEDALIQVSKLGFFVRDFGLLESALHRPRTTVFGVDAYKSLELKSAAQMHSLVKNHPLVDGNKRTAWVLFVSFLFINGYQHNMNDDQAFDLVLGLATDQLSLEQASVIIAKHLVERG
jgi:death-on-curing protein